ncbi:hypothetical protein MLD38_021709 [Melastoma candidum]|uniref:Uncharacterized protein n=1 Tax=Melastoma candidum TaxID=119954 RepID=A0ACB9QKT4_9MYRT|nr:hypothetical protein MLD38_021709 [Melastoma candidum]
MENKVWRWVLGLTYIVAVAIIWIAASFVVQSVVDAGVSPFLITYICNSLFVVYVPIAEILRYVEDGYGSLLFWRKGNAGGGNGSGQSRVTGESEREILLGECWLGSKGDGLDRQCKFAEKGRWTRTRVAKASLVVGPFWFLAQLTFNLSLKYTTVTVSI